MFPMLLVLPLGLVSTGVYGVEVEPHREVISDLLSTVHDVNQKLTSFLRETTFTAKTGIETVVEAIRAYLTEKITILTSIQSVLNEMEPEEMIPENVAAPTYQNPTAPTFPDEEQGETTQEERLKALMYPTHVDMTTSCLTYLASNSEEEREGLLAYDLTSSLRRLTTFSMRMRRGKDLKAFVGDQAFLISKTGSTRVFPCTAHAYPHDGRFTVPYRSLYRIPAESYLDLLIDSSLVSGRRNREISRLMAATIINSVSGDTRIRLFLLSDRLTKIYEGQASLFNLTILSTVDHVDGLILRHTIYVSYLSSVAAASTVSIAAITGLYSSNKRWAVFRLPSETKVYLLQTNRELALDVYREDLNYSSSSLSSFLFSYLFQFGGQGASRQFTITRLANLVEQSTAWMHEYQRISNVQVIDLTNVTRLCLDGLTCDFRTPLEEVLAQFRQNDTLLIPSTLFSSALGYKETPFLARPVFHHGLFLGVVACSLDLDLIPYFSMSTTDEYLKKSIMGLINFRKDQFIYKTDHNEWLALRNSTDFFTPQSLFNPGFLRAETLSSYSSYFVTLLQVSHFVTPTPSLSSVHLLGTSLSSFLNEIQLLKLQTSCVSSVFTSSATSSSSSSSLGDAASTFLHALTGSCYYDSINKLIRMDGETGNGNEVDAQNQIEYVFCHLLTLPNGDNITFFMFLPLTDTDRRTGNSLGQQQYDEQELERLFKEQEAITPSLRQQITVNIPLDELDVVTDSYAFYSPYFAVRFQQDSIFSTLMKSLVFNETHMEELALDMTTATTPVYLSLLPSRAQYYRLAALYLSMVYNELIQLPEYGSSYEKFSNEICTSYHWFGSICIRLTTRSRTYTTSTFLVNHLRAKLGPQLLQVYDSTLGMYDYALLFYTVYPRDNLQDTLIIGKNVLFHEKKVLYEEVLQAGSQSSLSGSTGTSDPYGNSNNNNDDLSIDLRNLTCHSHCELEQSFLSFNYTQYNDWLRLEHPCIATTVLDTLQTKSATVEAHSYFEKMSLTSTPLAYQSFSVHFAHYHPLTSTLHFHTSYKVDSSTFGEVMNDFLLQPCRPLLCGLSIVNSHMLLAYAYDTERANPFTSLIHNVFAEFNNRFCMPTLFDITTITQLFSNEYLSIHPVLASDYVCFRYNLINVLEEPSYSIVTPTSVLTITQVPGADIFIITRILKPSKDEQNVTALTSNLTSPFCVSSYTQYVNQLVSSLSKEYSFQYNNLPLKTYSASSPAFGDVNHTMQLATLAELPLEMTSLAIVALLSIIAFIVLLVGMKHIVETTAFGMRIQLYSDIVAM
ncbi:hypothetical protein GMRT_11698 [Giardia muris]|uniref:GH n=1 Tax=Giardia muris TaxID=5742 RepID=A0A4Z1SM09_GIAMU|nr:hypothetical protein GMRT_11698 [Giardia muris]|eukprot:TNJ26706.1 hypothetical protein GMRT_11698 [Giardia muris]